MDLHIGSEIKRVAKEKRIGTIELAQKIPMTRQNLDKIYRKKSIDSDLLYLICRALDFNFFALYDDKYKFANGLDASIVGPDVLHRENNALNSQENRIQQLENTVQSLENTIKTHLDTINTLQKTNDAVKSAFESLENLNREYRDREIKLMQRIESLEKTK